jgi:hypothetical protein
MRFTKPFKKDQIVIYKNTLGEVDSIKFFKWELDTIKYRNFSQGFYNENILRVKYQLLNHSYHKINYGAGLSNYELVDNYFSFMKSRNGHSDKTIDFLGLAFDRTYINKIIATSDSSVVFDKNHAEYTGLNINEGINNFKFNFKKGIISFVDNRNVKWTRMN